MSEEFKGTCYADDKAYEKAVRWDLAHMSQKRLVTVILTSPTKQWVRWGREELLRRLK